MKRNEIFLYTVWLGIGISVAAVSYNHLKLGSLDEPGPGLMPFLLGVCLSVCSVLLTAHYFLVFKGKEKQDQEGVRLRVVFKKIILVVSSLVVYILLFEKIGFVVMTFFFLLILFKIVDSRKWYWALLAAFLTVFTTYSIFCVLLGVELPLGVWRIR